MTGYQGKSLEKPLYFSPFSFKIYSLSRIHENCRPDRERLAGWSPWLLSLLKRARITSAFFSSLWLQLFCNFSSSETFFGNCLNRKSALRLCKTNLFIH